jgi:hypothetical protein
LAVIRSFFHLILLIEPKEIILAEVGVLAPQAEGMKTKRVLLPTDSSVACWTE